MHLRALSGGRKIKGSARASLTAYSSYAKAIGLVDQWNAKGINGSLQLIYTLYEVVGVLWLTLGIFLSVTSAYVKNTSRNDLSKQ